MLEKIPAWYLVIVIKSPKTNVIRKTPKKLKISQKCFSIFFQKNTQVGKLGQKNHKKHIFNDFYHRIAFSSNFMRKSLLHTSI